MPYEWIQHQAPDGPQPQLRLWPHRSLPRKGFAAMILLAFTFGTVPLYGLIGTVFLWGLLPFILLMVGALWWGLERSYKDGEILETLTLRADDTLELRHVPVRGDAKTWICNIYWTRTEMHLTSGPVPFYVTLAGNGRTVEIGSFLSEDERKALYADLSDFLKTAQA